MLFPLSVPSMCQGPHWALCIPHSFRPHSSPVRWVQFHLLNKETEAQLCPLTQVHTTREARLRPRTSSSLPSSPPSNHFSPGWTDSLIAWMSPQGVGTHCWYSLLRDRYVKQGPGLGAQASTAGLLFLLQGYSQGFIDGSRPPDGYQRVPCHPT